MGRIRSEPDRADSLRTYFWMSFETCHGSFQGSDPGLSTPRVSWNPRYVVAIRSTNMALCMGAP